MHDLRAAGGECVSILITEVVQKLGFRGLVRIGSVDAVDVGPDHQFVGVNGVRNNRAGKIGAVAAQRSDAAVRGGADETSNYGNDVMEKKREQQLPAALAGSLEV